MCCSDGLRWAACSATCSFSLIKVQKGSLCSHAAAASVLGFGGIQAQNQPCTLPNICMLNCGQKAGGHGAADLPARDVLGAHRHGHSASPLDGALQIIIRGRPRPHALVWRKADGRIFSRPSRAGAQILERSQSFKFSRFLENLNKTSVSSFNSGAIITGTRLRNESLTASHRLAVSPRSCLTLRPSAT
jgi:hypothetical protein